jgi:ferredoxin
MKVMVHPDECIDCGSCSAECPEFFEEDATGGGTRVVAAYRAKGNPAVGLVPDHLVDCVRRAVDACPVEGITIEQ